MMKSFGSFTYECSSRGLSCVGGVEVGGIVSGVGGDLLPVLKPSLMKSLGS